jgi:hypothetical protein
MTDEDSNVFKYNVCWQGKVYVSDEVWNIKVFSKKQDAKNFARKMKNKTKQKPYPYIIQRITTRTTFAENIEVERCKEKYQKNDWFEICYKKIIKY